MSFLLSLFLVTITFFQSGAEKFEALLEDMRNARQSIHVEYFIFANDGIGRHVVSVMKQKAAEGVEVQLLIDGYYDKQRGYNYASRLDTLRAAGIDIRIYDEYKFPYLNHVLRDHRKIVVIDDSIAYTGGFNVADYNIKGKPGIYGAYIDTHVRLVGDGVAELQQLFRAHFGEGLEKLDSLENLDNLEILDNLENLDASVGVWQRSHATRAQQRQMRDSIAALIDSARDSININSPYFVPPLGIRKALRRAIDRGVKVSVMFSEKGDTPQLDHGNKHYGLKLTKRGAEVLMYTEGFLHSKVITVDGHTAMVGSVNLDCRALRFNEEVAVVIRNPEAAAWLDSAYCENRNKSIPLTNSYYRKMLIQRRIFGWLADNLLYWAL